MLTWVTYPFPQVPQGNNCNFLTLTEPKTCSVSHNRYISSDDTEDTLLVKTPPFGPRESDCQPSIGVLIKALQHQAICRSDGFVRINDCVMGCGQIDFSNRILPSIQIRDCSSFRYKSSGLRTFYLIHREIWFEIDIGISGFLGWQFVLNQKRNFINCLI